MNRKTSSEMLVPSPKAVQKQFTMLPADVDLIEELRLRFQRAALGRTSKPVDIAKSEIIRAGIHSLSRMTDAKLCKAIEAVEELKEGRRKNAFPPTHRRNSPSDS